MATCPIPTPVQVHRPRHEAARDEGLVESRVAVEVLVGAVDIRLR